jgi:hypothetical protein
LQGILLAGRFQYWQLHVVNSFFFEKEKKKIGLGKKKKEREENRAHKRSISFVNGVWLGPRYRTEEKL